MADSVRTVARTYRHIWRGLTPLEVAGYVGLDRDLGPVVAWSNCPVVGHRAIVGAQSPMAIVRGLGEMRPVSFRNAMSLSPCCFACMFRETARVTDHRVAGGWIGDSWDREIAI